MSQADYDRDFGLAKGSHFFIMLVNVTLGSAYIDDRKRKFLNLPQI